MDQAQTIMVVVGIVIACGGFIATCIIAMIAFFMRRLIKTVDDMKIALEKMTLQLAETPDFTASNKLSKDAAEHRVVVHERDKHSAGGG